MQVHSHCCTRRVSLTLSIAGFSCAHEDALGTQVHTPGAVVLCAGRGDGNGTPRRVCPSQGGARRRSALPQLSCSCGPLPFPGSPFPIFVGFVGDSSRKAVTRCHAGELHSGVRYRPQTRRGPRTSPGPACWRGRFSPEVVVICLRASRSHECPSVGRCGQAA